MSPQLSDQLQFKINIKKGERYRLDRGSQYQQGLEPNLITHSGRAYHAMSDELSLIAVHWGGENHMYYPLNIPIKFVPELPMALIKNNVPTDSFNHD